MLPAQGIATKSDQRHWINAILPLYSACKNKKKRKINERGKRKRKDKKKQKWKFDEQIKKHKNRNREVHMTFAMVKF
jgi:hypothetical protein